MVWSLVAVDRVRTAKSPALSRKTTGRYSGWIPFLMGSALLSVLDVVSHDGVELLQAQAVRCVAPALARDVGVSGSGGGLEFDDGAGLVARHGSLPFFWGSFLCLGARSLEGYDNRFHSWPRLRVPPEARK